MGNLNKIVAHLRRKVIVEGIFHALRDIIVVHSRAHNIFESFDPTDALERLNATLKVQVAKFNDEIRTFNDVSSDLKIEDISDDKIDFITRNLLQTPKWKNKLEQAMGDDKAIGQLAIDVMNNVLGIPQKLERMRAHLPSFSEEELEGSLDFLDKLPEPAFNNKQIEKMKQTAEEPSLPTASKRLPRYNAAAAIAGSSKDVLTADKLRRRGYGT